ncbi:Rha family transcriptional regulator [Lactiplantibacillus pentosus]|uniref:Rha family transcriptional regulator n=1 Tax=Lactiplantibacillus pentosus TaxID=1589 RepID=UPI001B3967D5|nr:Rha family transcriptional regulator [Lactiplantibacillus pentosus]MBQ0837546.1 Rha family transcriptional regulator [Lactiplantibacillus pentosus]
MNKLVIMHNQQAVTTSLQVAKAFGKNHQHVLRDISVLQDKSKSLSKNGQTLSEPEMFHQATYVHPQNGQEYPIIYMNRDGFTLLAMGFTGQRALEFKLQYIKAFNEMEQQIKYSALPKSPRELAKLALNANEETNQRLDDVEDDLKDLKENQVIPQPDYNLLARRINQRVSEVSNSYGNIITQKQRGELFKDINGGVKKIAGVSARSMLRKKDYQMVMDYVNDWEPSTATKTIIRQTTLTL